MKLKLPVLVNHDQMAQAIGLPVEVLRELIAENKFPHPQEFKGHERWHLEETLMFLRADGWPDSITMA